MIPRRIILLLEDEFSGFAVTSTVTPFYGYFPPTVTIYANNRIFIQSDIRVTIEQSNIVTLRK